MEINRSNAGHTVSFIKNMPLWVILGIRWLAMNPEEQDENFDFAKSAVLCDRIASFFPESQNRATNRIITRIKRELMEWRTALAMYASMCELAMRIEASKDENTKKAETDPVANG